MITAIIGRPSMGGAATAWTRHAGTNFRDGFGLGAGTGRRTAAKRMTGRATAMMPAAGLIFAGCITRAS